MHTPDPNWIYGPEDEKEFVDDWADDFFFDDWLALEEEEFDKALDDYERGLFGER